MKKILLAQSGVAFGEEEEEPEPGAAAVVYQPARETIVVDKKAEAIQVLIGGLYRANLLLLLPEETSAPCSAS